MRPADTHRSADRPAGITGGQRTACDRNPRKQSGTGAHGRRRHVQVTPVPPAASPAHRRPNIHRDRQLTRRHRPRGCQAGGPQLRQRSWQEVDGPPAPIAQRGCANLVRSVLRGTLIACVPWPPTCASRALHRKHEGRDGHPDRPAGVSTASRRGSAARDRSICTCKLAPTGRRGSGWPRRHGLESRAARRAAISSAGRTSCSW